MLESPIGEELHTPKGYALYFKRFSKVHQTVLELACKVLGVALCTNSAHVNKVKFNKADFAKSLLKWVRKYLFGQYHLHFLTLYDPAA